MRKLFEEYRFKAANNPDPNYFLHEYFELSDPILMDYIKRFIPPARVRYFGLFRNMVRKYSYCMDYETFYKKWDSLGFTIEPELCEYQPGAFTLRMKFFEGGVMRQMNEHFVSNPDGSLFWRVINSGCWTSCSILHHHFEDGYESVLRNRNMSEVDHDLKTHPRYFLEALQALKGYKLQVDRSISRYDNFPKEAA